MKFNIKNYRVTVLFISAFFVQVLNAQNKRFTQVSSQEIIAKVNESKHISHPRLLLDSLKFQTLKKNIKEDGELQSWMSNVEIDAKAILSRKKPSIGRSSQTDILTLAFLYRISGNKKYKKGIESILTELFKLSEWDKQGMLKLDGSMRSYGVAIAYDWLYYDWSDSFREEIEKQLLEKTFLAYEKSIEKNIWWLDARFRQVAYYNNHNSVCNTGPLLAGLALVDHKDYQQEASNVISTAINSIYSGTLVGLLPDGAWDEGPGYYGYAMYHFVDGLASVMNTLQTDFKYLDQKGLQKTADFHFHVNGSAGAFNYGDGTSRKSYAPYLYWMAENVPNNESMGARYYQVSKEVGHRASVKDLLYFKKSYRNSTLISALPLDATFRQLELATMRSSWKNNNASFIAVKGSKGNMSHGNADAGHVIFQSQGESWFIDNGGEPYNKKYFDYETTRYFYYRAMAEGHNTMVINPGKEYQQDIDIFTRITDMQSRSEQVYALLDLNPAYHKHTLQNTRAVGLIHNRQIGIVQDELRLRKPSEFWSFFHTLAKIEIIGDGTEAILSQNGKKILVKLISENKELKFENMAAVKLDETPKAATKEYNNSIIRKLAIHAENVSKMAYAVLMIPFEDVVPELDLAFLSSLDWSGDLVYKMPSTLNMPEEDVTSNREYSKLKLKANMISLSQNEKQIELNALIDDNPNTYWQATTQSNNYKDYNPQYATIKLRKTTVISAFGVEWHSGYQRNYGYEVEVSLDGKNYKQVAQGVSAVNNKLQKIKFSPVETRYVRIKCKGTVRGKSLINEIALFQ